jgi:hypothetical protein
MPIDRSLWKDSIMEEYVPEWPCTFCNVPALYVLKESFKTVWDRESESIPQHEFCPDMVTGRFVCILCCRRCREAFAVSGNFDTVADYEGYEERGHPTSITPPPPLIEIPRACPAPVRAEVVAACSLYWCDLAASLNRIRNALELVLDHLKVPKSTMDRTRGKKRRLGLHDRIVKLEQRRPKLKDLCERMMAVKYLGNAGSHPGVKVDADDVFDGFDILEQVLHDMYSAHPGLLARAVKQINRNKGPRKPQR